MSSSDKAPTNGAPQHQPHPHSSQPSKVGYRCRSNYFLPGDIVWIRPARLPYWPAEVLDSDEPSNRVRATLVDPPSAELLAANLKEEQHLHAKEVKKLQAKLNKRRKTETAADAAPKTKEELKVEDDYQRVEGEEVRADIVTSNGLKVFFFDKLHTPEEVEEAAAHRLRRESHDVSAYEGAFYKALLHANRLVRTVFSPEKLLPYEVCGIGVVHSLMRYHVDAPRQPSTKDFKPQTGLIRIRSGLENAARNLQGFEYIWVLFQFSYAAAMATGEGQNELRKMKAEEEAKAAAATGDGGAEDQTKDEKAAPADTTRATTALDADEVRGDPLKSWRHRQGITRCNGFNVMLIPPRDEELRGVFATRSPHRPNFIGISCVRLIAVQGLDIFIADHDLLHGTPVLDIKPYLPFCDAKPNARAGWVDELEASGRGKGDHKYEKQEHRVDRMMEEEATANEKAE